MARNKLNEAYRVIHPLNDSPEEKLVTEGLAPMHMSRTVKFSLLVLRGYLVLMTLMLGYYVFQLAGVLGA